MNEVFLTQEGYDELKKRYDYLVVYLREDLAKKLQHARELGDLSENAEYDAAKQEEGLVNFEMKQIEQQLKNAHIVEKSGNSQVSIGNKVTLEYLGDLEEGDERVVVYQLVGETEADYKKGKISTESMLGKELIGKKIGEIASYFDGAEQYKVLAIN